jgi:hypothetical protein
MTEQIQPEPGTPEPTAADPTVPLSKAEHTVSPLLGGVGELPPIESTQPPVPEANPQPAWLPPQAPRGPRIATILWGFILIVVAVAILAVAFGAVVDFGLLAIGVLAVAGATLVISSIVSSARRRNRTS